jgi:hypothetical protein
VLHEEEEENEDRVRRFARLLIKDTGMTVICSKMISDDGFGGGISLWNSK